MSRIRLSQEEFERRVEEKNPGKYEILSAYKKQHEKVLVRHKECGYEWNVDPWNLMSGKIKKCPLCNNKWKRDTEDFKKEVRLLYGDEYEVLGEYISTNMPILMKHKTCGKEFMRIPREFKQGVLCPTCRRPNYHETTDSFKKRIKLERGDRYDLLDEYRGARERTLFLCKKCGGKFFSTPDNVIRGHGCPKCSISRGEEKIDDWLKAKGFRYKRQYADPSCRDKRALRFDFAVLDDGASVLALIEYDGVHHFRPVRFCAEMKNKLCEANLEDVKAKDKIKSEFCKTRNIPLIRISYKDFGRVEKILESSLRKIIPCQAV